MSSLPEKLYFDHAASTPMSPNAVQVLTQASEKLYANSAAKHSFAKATQSRIEDSRELFLQELGGKRDFDLIFLASATEANNMVFHTLAVPGAKAYVSMADHPSITAPAQLSPWSVNEYQVSANSKELEHQLSEPVELIVLTHVNSNSGTILPLKELCVSLREKFPKTHIHIDAAQSFGKLSLNLSQLDVDSVALSAHKMGGPKGVSALVFRKEFQPKPLLVGGGHENGLRASTPAAPLILSWAASLVPTSEREESFARIHSLQENVRTELQKALPDLIFPFPLSEVSPYILSLIHPHIPSDLFLRHLDERSIYVSSSSACSSRVKAFSPAFASIGIPEEHHKSVMRVSFGFDSTDAEADRFCEHFIAIYRHLISSQGSGE